MAEIVVKLKPWTPPTFAQLATDGRVEARVAVKDMPKEALDGVVEEWLVELYQKAGKPMPWARVRGGAV